MSWDYDKIARDTRKLVLKKARPGERNWAVLRRIWEIDRIVAKELCGFAELDPMEIPVPKS